MVIESKAVMFQVVYLLFNLDWFGVAVHPSRKLRVHFWMLPKVIMRHAFGNIGKSEISLLYFEFAIS
jgi:hypothetical protein